MRSTWNNGTYDRMLDNGTTNGDVRMDKDIEILTGAIDRLVVARDIIADPTWKRGMATEVVNDTIRILGEMSE